jgi:septal ring factor EnvC (AmiA/AmiB activator)
MSVRAKKLILLFWLVLGVGISSAQKKSDLELKKAKIQKEIDFTNKQLQIVSKNKSATAEQLATLRKKIKLRESLINTINSEINTIGGEIQNTSRQISTLESDLKQLREEYAAMIRLAYRNRNVYQRMMFVFAANDFNQAYKRLRYFQQYAEFRRSQAAKIEETQVQLAGKKLELEVRKNEKTSLRNNEQQEKSTLEKERKDQDKLMQNLTAREKKLRKELAEKQAAKKKLDRAIENLIKKEMDAARKKATAAGNKNVTNKNVFSMTPEGEKLTNSFSGNRGLLPWPVEQGSVSGSFGEHPHKELKGIMVKNNGIDIQTSRGASARAIFEGTVSGVISIPGSGKAVIIRHGSYLSVYSNLQSVNVSTGEKVTTKQRIGAVGLNEDDDRGELHLEIWNNTTKLDPQGWLARR